MTRLDELRAVADALGDVGSQAHRGTAWCPSTSADPSRDPDCLGCKALDLTTWAYAELTRLEREISLVREDSAMWEKAAGEARRLGSFFMCPECYLVSEHSKCPDCGVHSRLLTLRPEAEPRDVLEATNA